ncbi:MAG: DUF3380 domain-containing protein [Calditrichaeota bacterium]|nr:MAG: DUF3380 domain-containing protein [Calditrichota bacterium]
MRGKVTANRLNIRSLPSLSAKKIGTLPKDTVVSIVMQHDAWFEIKYNEMSAFLSSEFVLPIENTVSIQGKITASKLNVRSEPNLHSEILGALVWDSRVDILDENGEWLEISFNEESAFIHQDYVQLLESRLDDMAVVSVDRLNVRARPDATSNLLGVLERDMKVKVISQTGKWCEISFNDIPAFIHSDFIERGETASSSSAQVVSPDDTQDKIVDQTEMVPDEKLPLVGSKIAKKVARTWNKYGGLLESLSGAHKIDPGAAVAVLCVESSGKGFEPQNENRMIIRFENHLMWKYWGKKNTQKFHRHFQYGKRENNKLKVWLGHTWRDDPTDSWSKFHGNQSKEWQVLDFARKLSETEALYCISMGAPQIMGFNYKAIGYDSVQEMFEKFNQDIRYHIQGLFEFFDKRMIKALQNRDFVEFAGYYNGSGQKQKYGEWIQNHFDAFQELTS